MIPGYTYGFDESTQGNRFKACLGQQNGNYSTRLGGNTDGIESDKPCAFLGKTFDLEFLKDNRYNPDH